MPYGDILQRAFDIVRRERALWVLGILMALFGGGGGGGGGGGNVSVPGGGGGGPDVGPPPAWLTPSFVITIVAIVIVVGLVLMIVGLVVRSVALAGLIHGADRATAGASMGWRELWRVGWSEIGRRIIWMKVLLALPLLLLVLAGICSALLAALPLISAAATGSEPGPAAGIPIVAIVCLIIPLALIGVVGGIALQLIGNYAAREIVLERRETSDAIRAGWRLLRANLGPTIAMGILLLAIGFVVGLLLLVVTIFVALAVGLPLFALLAATEFPLVLSIGGGLLALLIVIAVGATLQGPLLAFNETAWTLTWRHLSSPLAPEEELALA